MSFISDGSVIHEWIYGEARMRVGINPGAGPLLRTTTPVDHPGNPDGGGEHPERPDHAWLHHPALTGLDPIDWNELIEKLDVARHAQLEASLHHRRGGARRTAAGTGAKPSST